MFTTEGHARATEKDIPSASSYSRHLTKKGHTEMLGHSLARAWKDACNSHDLQRIVALYSDDVVFKSPRIAVFLGGEDRTLYGKGAVREYWAKILDARPALKFETGLVFAGVDTVAIEYRLGNRLHGIEFMVVNEAGLVSFAAGNDVVGPLGRELLSSGKI